MRKTATWLLFSMTAFHFSISQNVTADSSQTLGEVFVKAYEQNQSLRKVPAAINKINKASLERFSNTNILPALNSTSGVRMEERSPGSYRMNIRGSTLRSPFGVRNVKVYWDEIPFTDPGGNTYLNQLSYYNFNSIEIIKGPAGSLYGAGTGGAILINSNAAHPEPGLMVNLSYGSYDHSNVNVQFNQGTNNFRNSFTYSHQQSHGYRDHTSMRRDVATWQTQISSGKKNHCISIFFTVICFMKLPVLLRKLNIAKIPQQLVLQREHFQVPIKQRRQYIRKHGWVDLIIIINSMTTLKIV
jgi:iron complex outermembrane receptor protein